MTAHRCIVALKHVLAVEAQSSVWDSVTVTDALREDRQHSGVSAGGGCGHADPSVFTPAAGGPLTERPTCSGGGVRVVDLNRASDTVSPFARHVQRRVRHACDRPVRGVNRLFQGVTERRCLAVLDALRDDLVRLHDVVDIESKVSDGGVKVPAQPCGEITRQLIAREAGR